MKLSPLPTFWHSKLWLYTAPGLGTLSLIQEPGHFSPSFAEGPPCLLLLLLLFPEKHKVLLMSIWVPLRKRRRRRRTGEELRFWGGDIPVSDADLVHGEEPEEHRGGEQAY